MRQRLAGLIMGLAACGAGMMPAAAQTAGEILFAGEATILRPKRPAGAPPAEPTPALATGFNLSSPPLGPSFQPWTRPAQVAASAPTVSMAPTVAAQAPLPPRAPRAGTQLSSAPSAAGPPAQAAPENKPLVIAAVPPAPVVKAEPLTDREIVDRANAFFTHLGTLVADFIQIGGDGRRLSGTLYLQRPGKVRFEYDRPATLEVIADGSSVAVRDTKLATQDLYSLSQTPLKFLLREKVNLGQDIRITAIANDGDAVRLSLEDKSTLGGTSKITLFFDPQVEELTQWRIVDAQGFLTTVMLNKIQRGRRIDQSLFVISYDRAIPDNNR
jgi:outer membrane lipoprotein-sorting protein